MLKNNVAFHKIKVKSPGVSIFQQRKLNTSKPPDKLEKHVLSHANQVYNPGVHTLHSEQIETLVIEDN